MSTLALFDFDGTISNKDSLLHFTMFMKGRLRLGAGLLFLSPLLVLNKLGAVTADAAKEKFLSLFFKGMHTDVFNGLCNTYAVGPINTIIRQSSLKAITEHKAGGHRVVVVSASPENYLAPWCALHEVECVSTKLTIENNRVTGKIDGRNCKGQEKLDRVKAVLDLNKYPEIYGYGNSSGDNAMLSVCTKKFYKYFND